MLRRITVAFAVASLVRGGLPRRVQAQALGGRVVDATTKRALAAIPVRLLRAAPSETAEPRDTTALASTVTGSDGVFMLAAPAPGSYRARIGDAFFAPAVRLADPDSFEAREYALDLRAGLPCGALTGAAQDAVVRAGGTFCGSQVGKQAAAVPRSLVAYFPEALKTRFTSGTVTVQFVIDTTGRAEMNTWAVLASTDVLFSRAAQDGVRRARFYPAEIGGRKVKEKVQLPFTFTLADSTGAAVRDLPPLFPPPFRPLPRATGFP